MGSKFVWRRNQVIRRIWLRTPPRDKKFLRLGEQSFSLLQCSYGLSTNTDRTKCPQIKQIGLHVKGTFIFLWPKYIWPDFFVYSLHGLKCKWTISSHLSWPARRAYFVRYLFFHCSFLLMLKSPLALSQITQKAMLSINSEGDKEGKKCNVYYMPRKDKIYNKTLEVLVPRRCYY